MPLEFAPSAPVAEVNNGAPSQAVFHDSADFFRTLQGILPKADAEHPDNIDKNDLIVYSQTGDDIKGRAAATTAVQHWEGLRSLPVVFSDIYPTSQAHGLSQKELSIDLALATNNLKSTMDDYNLTLGARTALVGLGTMAVGVGMIFAFRRVPMGVPTGFNAAVTGAVLTGKFITEMIGKPKEAEIASIQARKELAVWSKEFQFQRLK